MLRPGRRVRVYVSEGDRIEGRPAHLALLELLRREGAAGATCFKAHEGFGAGRTLHVAHLVDVDSRLPLVVEWVDEPARVDRVLPLLRSAVGRGLVTVDDTSFDVPPEDAAEGAIPARLVAADVMTRGVDAVPSSAPLGDLVERMVSSGHRAVPVVSAGRPIGIVTQGDLVARGGIELRIDLLGGLAPAERTALLAGLARSERTAADVMTPDPITISTSTPVRDAAETMARRRLKRLPVVDADGRLAGILSRVDVLRTVARGAPRPTDAPPPAGLEATAPVARLVRRDVPTLLPDAPLAEVFQAVISTRLNRALVVDEARHVLGVVSDGELLDRLAPPLRQGVFSALARRLPFAHADREAAERHATARRAADLMAEVPRTRAETPLRDAIALVLGGAHKLLAVVDAEGRLEGVLDRADLLRGLLADRRPG
jgi:CBS domain-containing protein